MKKIFEIAYNELKKLEDIQNPSWETYEHFASLITVIRHFEEEHINIQETELSKLIEEIKDNYGCVKTLEILTASIVEFQKDIDCVSPHLTQCLIKRLKENL